MAGERIHHPRATELEAFLLGQLAPKEAARVIAQGIAPLAGEEVVWRAVRYEAQPRLRLAGYLWPEVPARIAGTPYLWTERDST